MKPVLSGPIDTSRWHSFWNLLAWERAEPALQELGLGHLDLPGLRQHATRYLRARQDRRISRGESGEDWLREEQALLDGALHGIGTDLGPPTLVRVLSVAESINYSGGGPAYYLWAAARLSHWPEESEAGIDLPLADGAQTVVVGAVTRWRADHFLRLRRMADEIERAPPSPLELEIGPKDGTGALIGLPLLEHALQLGPARGLWSEIRAGLGASELDELVAWLNEEDERDDLGADVIPTRVRGLDDLA